jgi:hypothetical protein
MAMSGAERQKRLRERKKRAGIVQATVFCTPQQIRGIRRWLRGEIALARLKTR